MFLDHKTKVKMVEAVPSTFPELQTPNCAKIRNLVGNQISAGRKALGGAEVALVSHGQHTSTSLASCMDTSSFIVGGNRGERLHDSLPKLPAFDTLFARRA